ncbi:MAG: nucleotidyltransferase domain-containing protein [Actinomycetota bacterium]|nr:nucleotidyltransferase domain-containing protein [Actinomycetota bacterium]MDI6821818.1 nucleotidyltransferase domain-containing protein [Actinomycetota bacterium]
MIKFKKIEHDPRGFFPELIEMFKQDEEVIAVYLFGSYATGNIGPLSDVDIAVLLNPKFPSESYFDKELDLLLKTSHILRTDEVNLVILNRAPFSLAYGIFSENKLLFCRNDLERVKFETKIVDGYLDFKPLLEENYRYLYRRVKEGKFGVKS